MTGAAGEFRPSGPTAAFSYHRSVAPMLWVFVALASTELLVVHALLSHWFPQTALVLSGLSLATVIWLVAAIRSFRRLPVLIEADALTMRVGLLKSYRVPLADIVGLRESWTAEELKARQVANLALIAWPNIWIDLAGSVGRRGVTAIAHKLDEAAAFKAALNERLPRAAPVISATAGAQAA